MKVKKYLSVLAVACAGALTLAGCSDYDNGYNESAIKFQEEFKKAYGDIDPEQDWNLAERATVTVNTQTESNIKIYAIRGNEFAIVGDYEGVKGTRVLGVDLVEGSNLLYVTDGRTAQKCAPGDVVVFNGQDTRTTHPGNGYVTVSKLQGSVDDLGDGKTYPQYKYATTQEELDGILDVIPEGKVNLKRVTHDFTFVSNGTFLIYPYYWVTSSRNTIGLYYYDDNGQRVEVDIYTAKEANSGDLGELQYEDAYDGSEVKVTESFPNDLGAWNRHVAPTDWTINNGYEIHYNNWTKAENGMQLPYIEYWSSGNLGNATIERVIEDLEPGNYIVEIDARILKEGQNIDNPQGVTFYANGKSYDLSQFTKLEGTDDNGNPCAYRSGSIYLDVVTVNSDGKLNLSFNVNGANVNWLAFKNLKVSKMGTWKTAVDQGKNLVRKSQGIRVNIPAGTKFGMYLKKGDENNPSYQFYSEDELNNVSKTGSGIAYKGSGDDRERSNWQLQEGLQPCHTSTFYVGDQMFIGFEDWPNDANQSDFDLNDLVLAFDGHEPTIINEDPEVSSCWLLVCEDLGGSFDTDYNDVIFKVEHVSGQKIAKVTPMAAGGTLASYIVFNDPTQGATNPTTDYVVGEIHQLFGAGPQPSGQYAVINATSRWEKGGATVEIPVDENWQIAYNVDDVSYTYDNLSGGNWKGANMGGFYILTLTSGTEVRTNSPTVGDLSSSKASVIAAPGKGDAPYILCLPYTYTKDENGKRNTYVWAWPQELCTICSAAYDQNGKYNGSTGGAYLYFAAWVDNSNGKNGYTSNKDWYKNKNINGATVETWLLSSQDINDNNKNASTLGHSNDLTVTAGVGDHHDLIIRNLTGTSGGTISIYLDSPNGEAWDGTTLWNVGERTVYVTEAATETTQEGTTSFKITVKPKENEKIYGIAFTLQIGSQQETSLYKFDTNEASIDVTANMGDYFWIFSKNPNNRWEEYHRDGFAAAYNNNVTTTNIEIGTNDYDWGNAIGFKVTHWGYQKVTLHAPGNDLYTDQTVKINVNVTGKVIMKSQANGKDWAMALIDGQLKTVEYNVNDNRQKWYVEGTVDDNGNLQSYGDLLNLRNVETGQYLGFDKSNQTLVVQSNKPSVSGNFTFIEEADGEKFKYKFRDGKNPTGWYLGLTSFTAENGAYPTGLTKTESQICKFNMVIVP